MCKTFLNCNLQLWFAPQKNNTGIPLYSCKQAKPAPSVWQLSCNNTDINYLLTTIPFQHLMYRITAVYISCVIKFNSKRKLSNYMYKTTPLFLSTNQKISTKNDLWVSCKCTPGTWPVGTLCCLMPCFTVHRNYIIPLQWLKWTMAANSKTIQNLCQQGDNSE